VEELQPDNAEAWLESGFAYESQGIQDKAMTDYSRAISVAPNFYKPYQSLGAFYFHFGRYAEAEGPYKKAIALAPERANGYGNLAGVYTAQFKYAEAEQLWKSLLQHKETALTLNNVGAMLAYQGKQKEALEYYQRAVKLDPNRAMYWLNLGDSQRRINEEGNARKSYRQALQLYQKEVIANPADASSVAYLAYLEARLGFREEAELRIHQALNAPARDDRVVLSAVKAYEVLGERDKALAAALLATAQTRNQMAHHPDLAGLREKLR